MKTIEQRVDDLERKVAKLDPSTITETDQGERLVWYLPPYKKIHSLLREANAENRRLRMYAMELEEKIKSLSKQTI